ncbi:hypothetical protein MTR67_051751 [Solanum verrucosum]|uniref:DUF4283 domain-containing protein n=1 Tax=Solanum verrucosum TaxID=315347 RepID=A0AAF1A0E6_SOLVR|nr:hypothetical protein MTR67_051751 [Solanum verrucosum]
MKIMENFVVHNYKYVKNPQILLHDEGYFLFRFDTVEERDKVMQDSPYTYFNKPFVLQNWDIDFEFNPDCITTIPCGLLFQGCR